MSSWGNNDNAANAPYWAVNSTITHAAGVSASYATPTAANVARLYANTTANVYIAGETIGLFNIDAQEIAAQRAEETADGTESGETMEGKFAHAGWNLVTVGSGGRAGRVQTETLVALANVIGDGDSQIYANVSITLSSLSNGSVASNASFANVVTFSTTASLAGNTASTLTYQWQYLNGGTWTNLGANTTDIHYSGLTKSTLYAMPATTAASGTKYRVVVAAPDEGVTAYSSNAVITIS
jgi:hypothetical protein